MLPLEDGVRLSRRLQRSGAELPFSQGLDAFQTFLLRCRQSLRAGAVMGALILQAGCFRGTPACTGCKTPSDSCQGLATPQGSGTAPAQLKKRGQVPITPELGTQTPLPHTRGSMEEPRNHTGQESAPQSRFPAEQCRQRELQATGAAGNGSCRQATGAGSRGERAESAPGESPPARPFGRQRLGRSFSSVTGPSE